MTSKARVLILVGCSTSAATIAWGLTQWVAGGLAFQPALGIPWGRIAGWPVYAPWSSALWWLRYRNSAPAIFRVVPWGLALTSVPLVAALWMSSRGRTDGRPSTTYGSSRWADRRDVRRAGLFSQDGVMLGVWRGRYLRHAGPAHILAFAPTRSGKGVGLVLPTLLSWTGSAIVHDIKGENWAISAGWRSRFSHCLRFDPTKAGSTRFNPLLEVRRGAREVADVQNIVDILIDPEGTLERRNHWEQASHSLLVGAILHVLYVGSDTTLNAVARLLSDPEQAFSATLEEMRKANHLGAAGAYQSHPVVAAAARDLLNKSDAERSGILSTAIGFLALYRDPIIADATSASDWHIADLTDSASPVSLYLVVPPSDLSRTRALIRLILNQTCRRLTEQLPDPSLRSHELLLMLDEFPALGRLDFFETSLAFLAGYRVRAFLIAQSLHQIAKAYGENNSIIDNCHVRITFATNDERTAKRISDALGTSTQRRAMHSYAGPRLSTWLPNMTESHQETGRALLTPGEIMQLPADDAVVIVSGCPPIRANKLRYHQDRHFNARLFPVPTRRERLSDVNAGSERTACSPRQDARPAKRPVPSPPKPSPAVSQNMLGLEDLDVPALPADADGRRPAREAADAAGPVRQENRHG